MQTLFLTFGIFLGAAFLMAIGVIFAGKSLRGSCGGPSCTCATEGHDLGSCEINDELALPIHPSEF